ncbi:metallophosphoesterase [Pendulispora rubella]|uniref:Metallophosphoesterase n=1 Tax=Pendulispora rubella TaxID=2741070 RepID=A0ABZ2KRY3_9BACT
MREKEPPQAAESHGGDASSTAPIHRRRGGTDVTFFVLSDLHFGFGFPDDLKTLPADPLARPVGIERDHQRVIARMNGLAGQAYPTAMGGKVQTPRGLLLTGDLTERGRVEEWQHFVAYYGLRGREGLLKIPVFEGIGNHDRVHGAFRGCVEQRVVERHGGRFYSWDWDDVHLVSLGEAPDDEGLTFLANDLARYAEDVPIVIAFHFALEGPWSTGNWFSEGDFRSRLKKTMEKHRVIALFHGHHHATGHYRWNGVDVYKPGAVKDSTHTFSVVHVTDSKMTIARYDYEANTWEWWDEKKLSK